MTGLTRSEIRALTQARLTFGGRGAALDTASALNFSLDHAMAREAVLSELDLKVLGQDLSEAGLDHHAVTSRAATRDDFIRRPDLGRKLREQDAEALQAFGPVDVALVLGDGLSATAVALNGPAFISDLAARMKSRHLSVGPIVIARQARVALGDQIALAMQARTVVVALGERPGLSAADSLGVYITHQPAAQTQDSERNCLSNIRAAGMSTSAAAQTAEQLIIAMRQLGQSGVALNQAMQSAPLVDPDT